MAFKFSASIVFAVVIPLISLAQVGQVDLGFNPTDYGYHVGINANDAVTCIAQTIDGKTLIGGSHTLFNSYAVGRITKIDEHGAVDQGFAQGTGFNASVRMLRVLEDGKIIAAGDFTQYNQIARNSIVRLFPDGTLDQSFNIGLAPNTPIVSILTLPDGKLMACGNFTQFNGTPVNRIVRLNSDGSIDDTFQTAIGPNFHVNDMALDTNGSIVIIGNFSLFGTTSVGRIARLDVNGNIDDAFNTNIGTGFNASASHISLLSTGAIVVNGTFATFNGVAAAKVAQLHSSGILDNSFSSGTGPDGFASQLIVSDDDVIYLTGTFNTYNGQQAEAIARLNANGSLDNTFNAGSGTIVSEGVFDLLITDEGKLQCVGNFDTFQGVPRYNIVGLSATGQMDYTFCSRTAFPDGIIHCILPLPDGKILVGGTFSKYFESPVSGIIRLNADGSLDETFNYSLALTQVNGSVYTMHIDNDGTILIGGNFTQVNNTSVSNLARLYPEGTLDTFFTPNPNGAVNGILVQSDGKIIIGGTFTTVAGQSAAYLARISSAGVLDNFWAGNSLPNAGVEQLGYMPDGSILIGGEFLQMSNMQRVRLAHINTNGNLLNDFSAGVAGNFQSFTILPDGRVILCGQITQYGTNNIPKIARLTATGAFDNTFEVGTGADLGTLHALVDASQKIILVGEFTTFNGSPAGRIIRLNEDGSTDLSFDAGTGADHVIYRIQRLADGQLLIGGTFGSYNNIGRNGIAKLLACEPSQASLQVSGCDNVTINDNVYTTSGIYFQNLVNLAGCDSLISVEVDINYSTFENFAIAACNTYDWENETYSSSGVYTNTYTAVNGCDSIVQLSLTINGVNTVINQNNNSLSSAQSGASYQWIDCTNNNAAIPNATAQTFSPGVSGSYAVQITFGDCSEMSECFDFTYIGLEELKEKSEELKVFPNPVNHLLQWQGDNMQGPIVLTLYNALGQIIIHMDGYTGPAQLNVESLAQGTYYLRLTSNNKQWTGVFVK